MPWWSYVIVWVLAAPLLIFGLVGVVYVWYEIRRM